MPPRRPFSGRLRSSTAPSALTAQKATPRRKRLRRLGAPRRQRLGDALRAAAAGIAPGTEDAFGVLRRAQRSAEIHHRLRVVAGARCRRQRRGQAAQRRLGVRQRLGMREEPRHDALDIAVDRRCRAVEGDCRHRRRGIVADPRQRAQRQLIVGKAPILPRRHDARAGMEVARPRVIAQALPSMQHLVERGAGERREIGPAPGETLEIGRHGRHRGLLQHDLAEPDAVGVGALARLRPPRQGPAVGVIPGKQQRRQVAELDRRRGGLGFGGLARGGAHAGMELRRSITPSAPGPGDRCGGGRCRAGLNWHGSVREGA